MKGAISTEEISDAELLNIVSDRKIRKYGLGWWFVAVRKPKIIGEELKHSAVILDCGIKKNSIDSLIKRGIGVVVLHLIQVTRKF